MQNDPLSPEQINSYVNDGILVVEDLLSSNELYEARNGLVRTLRDDFGVDVHNLEETGHRLTAASSTNGAGGVLDIFYPEWKMKISANEKLFRMTCQLWKETCYHTEEELAVKTRSFKWHPFGAFDCNKGYMYIDRIGYRIPTVLAEKIGEQQEKTQSRKPTSFKQSKRSSKSRPIQRSLTPHFDCCPETFFDAQDKTKWRPIQCFISLTDNIFPNMGGFEAVSGFHKEFRSWAENGRTFISNSSSDEEQKEHDELKMPALHPNLCIGEYTHLNSTHDRKLLQRMKHIPVKAGSAVFWDNRIPHANSMRNDSPQLDNAGPLGTSGSRAVVYCSFLPDIQLNRDFIEKQLVDWKLRRAPRVGDRWIKLNEEKTCNCNTFCEHKNGKLNDSVHVQEENELKGSPLGEQLTDLEKRLLGLMKW